MEAIVDIQDLVVGYGHKTAVEKLSLQIRSGEFWALLGRNGAGKTSTLRVLLGMLKPKAGKALFFGQLPGHRSGYEKLGYAPEEAAPPEFLNGKEYLDFILSLRAPTIASEKRKELVGELLEWFELDAKKRIQAYSKGMRRRIILAQALAGEPKLLVLDEPLNGLDPVFIKKLRDRLEIYRQNGGSLLFSSHILSEVEKVCSHLAVLNEGNLRFSGTSSAFLEKFGSVEEGFVKLVGHE